MWRDYFIDADEHTEIMFQMFKERILDDPRDEWDRDDAVTERADHQRRAEEESVEIKYEMGEMYRKRHAKRNGYTFRPRDKDGDYIDPVNTLDHWDLLNNS